MAGDDRLSGLPDKLLRRILHFAPAKEAASTRALSRRWLSPLLRSSPAAVNLETYVESDDLMFCDTWGQERKDLEAVFFSRRDAFVSAAEAALDAAADHVTRLSLRVEFRNCAAMFLNYDSDGSQSRSQYRSVIARLLSHRAVQRVEEVRLAGECWYDRPGVEEDKDKEITAKFRGVYKLSLRSLPSETLRVLEIVYCDDILPAAAGAVFPRLSCLWLRRSAVHLDPLQSLIDAAPALATVHLESVLVVPTHDTISPTTPGTVPGFWPEEGEKDRSVEHGTTQAVLRCPAATVLVLKRCNWTEKDRSSPGNEPTPRDITLEIHAPRLRRLVYKGLLRQFSLGPWPPDLARADLHFLPHPYQRSNIYPRGKYRGDEDPYRKLDTFWEFLQNISSCKELRLRLNNLEDIAVLTEARRVELLPVFSNLECLELQGKHGPKGKSAAVAIANLLRCSPVLRQIRMDLTPAHHDVPRKCAYQHDYVYERDVETYEEWKLQSDRDKSLNLINRCRAEPTTIVLQGDDDGEAAVSGIPGLSRRSFECLQTSLRTVCLKFRAEGSNCLGVKLIKFFAENSMVLEEMHIDGGNEKLCNHLNHEIQTWTSMQRRSQGASSFVVLPLKR